MQRKGLRLEIFRLGKEILGTWKFWARVSILLSKQRKGVKLENFKLGDEISKIN